MRTHYRPKNRPRKRGARKKCTISPSTTRKRNNRHVLAVAARYFFAKGQELDRNTRPDSGFRLKVVADGCKFAFKSIHGAIEDSIKQDTIAKNHLLEKSPIWIV
ncbi:unnamed protein product [Litomosoides sigmodontis]|uniref:Uncharacterized protein n=1 Tax=Litomosoides sigmodontis TaxID=42156 RepID=A0A3P6SWU4_LITSI|nr:unnamed protein product [Litomosoides sigmodontis]